MRRLTNSWKDHELDTMFDFPPYVSCNPAVQGGQLNNFIIHQALEHSAVISHLEKFTAWGKGIVPTWIQILVKAEVIELKDFLTKGILSWGFKCQKFMWENTISLSEKKSSFHTTRCKDYEVRNPEEGRTDAARVRIGRETSEAPEWRKWLERRNLIMKKKGLSDMVYESGYPDFKASIKFGPGLAWLAKAHY